MNRDRFLEAACRYIAAAAPSPFGLRLIDAPIAQVPAERRLPKFRPILERLWP